MINVPSVGHFSVLTSRLTPSALPVLSHSALETHNPAYGYRCPPLVVSLGVPGLQTKASGGGFKAFPTRPQQLPSEVSTLGNRSDRKWTRLRWMAGISIPGMGITEPKPSPTTLPWLCCLSGPALLPQS